MRRLAAMREALSGLVEAWYAGVLSSLGLGFVATDRGLMGLTVTLLALGMAGLAWSARGHAHRGALLLAVGGAVLVIIGRLRASAPLLYIGTGLVAAAALWNFWLTRRSAREPVSLTVRDRAGHTL
jgi:hypothetical protein